MSTERTDQEINRTIAESLGWKIEKSNELDGNCWHLDGVQSETAPPDYCNDLNAMHEAEEYLDSDEAAEFARQLMRDHPTYCVTVLDSRDPAGDLACETFELIHARAHLRAEAWLKAKSYDQKDL